MQSIPNTETIRHLCHFYHATEYYLFMPKNEALPILVTDVDDHKHLRSELKSWCGMDIEVFHPDHRCTKVAQTIKEGMALHRAAENMDLVEE